MASTITPESVRRVVDEDAAGIYVDAADGLAPTALAENAVGPGDLLLFPADQVLAAYKDTGKSYTDAARVLTLTWWQARTSAAGTTR